MRKEGATYEMVAAALGVSRGRISVICKGALVVEAEEAIGLRTRSIKIIRGRAGRLAEIAAHAEEAPGGAIVALIKEANCDWPHAAEIIEWSKAGNREAP
jgi:hypothetical protein